MVFGYIVEYLFDTSARALNYQYIEISVELSVKIELKFQMLIVSNDPSTHTVIQAYTVPQQIQAYVSLN